MLPLVWEVWSSSYFLSVVILSDLLGPQDVAHVIPSDFRKS